MEILWIWYWVLFVEEHKIQNIFIIIKIVELHYLKMMVMDLKLIFIMIIPFSRCITLKQGKI